MYYLSCHIFSSNERLRRFNMSLNVTYAKMNARKSKAKSKKNRITNANLTSTKFDSMPSKFDSKSSEVAIGESTALLSSQKSRDKAIDYRRASR